MLGTAIVLLFLSLPAAGPGCYMFGNWKAACWACGYCMMNWLAWVSYARSWKTSCSSISFWLVTTRA